MRVHLLYSEEISQDRYQSVLDLLNSTRGPMVFQSYPEAPISYGNGQWPRRSLDIPKGRIEFPDMPVEGTYMSYSSRYDPSEPRPDDYHARPEAESLSWDKLFGVCRDFRRSHDLGTDEFVMLLTDLGNENNWFAAPDLNGERNIFVQTSGWGLFADGDWRFPVVYMIVTNVLRQLMVDNLRELKQIIHMESIGCMNDFTRHKREVNLKLRTGDICKDCAEILIKRQIDKNLVVQVLDSMELVRKHVLFRSRFAFTGQPSRMGISQNGAKIEFPDLPGTELNLAPKERALYLFFLKHPEGVVLVNLRDYKGEILELYLGVNRRDPQAAAATVKRLVDARDDSMLETISRIRAKVNHALGPVMGEFYNISGIRMEEYKIGIDRALVDWG